MTILSKFSHVLVLGRGGFGAELGEMLEDCGWGKPVFLDDNAADCAGALRDYVDPALRRQCPAAFVALGNNALRLQLIQKLTATGYKLPVFIHPAAEVSRSAVLGAGSMVLPFAFVGANVRAGAGCLLNAGAIVDHDAVLGAAVHVFPAVSSKPGQGWSRPPRSNPARSSKARGGKESEAAMCLICDRIALIQQGKNPYFVKELRTGYVVLGDNQHFRGYTLFLCKEHVTELFHLPAETQRLFCRRWPLSMRQWPMRFAPKNER